MLKKCSKYAQKMLKNRPKTLKERTNAQTKQNKTRTHPVDGIACVVCLVLLEWVLGAVPAVGGGRELGYKQNDFAGGKVNYAKAVGLVDAKDIAEERLLAEVGEVGVRIEELKRGPLPALQHRHGVFART